MALRQLQQSFITRELAGECNAVMYAYIDRKKKFPVTTLLRAIGYGSDKDILDLFGLSEEVPATKTNLKKVIGRKLAARVLKTWIEDFVDEDTGEVVSIDRNEVILERDSVINEEDIENMFYLAKAAIKSTSSLLLVNSNPPSQRSINE